MDEPGSSAVQRAKGRPYYTPAMLNAWHAKHNNLGRFQLEGGRFVVLVDDPTPENDAAVTRVKRWPMDVITRAIDRNPDVPIKMTATPAEWLGQLLHYGKHTPVVSDGETGRAIVRKCKRILRGELAKRVLNVPERLKDRRRKLLDKAQARASQMDDNNEEAGIRAGSIVSDVATSLVPPGTNSVAIENEFDFELPPHRNDRTPPSYTTPARRRMSILEDSPSTYDQSTSSSPTASTLVHLADSTPARRDQISICPAISQLAEHLLARAADNAEPDFVRTAQSLHRQTRQLAEDSLEPRRGMLDGEQTSIEARTTHEDATIYDVEDEELSEASSPGRQRSHTSISPDQDRQMADFFLHPSMIPSPDTGTPYSPSESSKGSNI